MYNMKLWRLSQALSQYRSLPSMYSSVIGVCAHKDSENKEKSETRYKRERGRERKAINTRMKRSDYCCIGIKIFHA